MPNIVYRTVLWWHITITYPTKHSDRRWRQDNLLSLGFLAWATYQDPDSKINKRKQKLYMKNSTCGKQTANSGNNLTVSVSKATVTSDAQKVHGGRERTFRKKQTLPSKDLHWLLLQVFFLLLGNDIKNLTQISNKSYQIKLEPWPYKIATDDTN